MPNFEPRFIDLTTAVHDLVDAEQQVTAVRAHARVYAAEVTATGPLCPKRLAAVTAAAQGRIAILRDAVERATPAGAVVSAEANASLRLAEIFVADFLDCAAGGRLYTTVECAQAVA